jgi:AraC family transcriptional regulator of adaptative response/methylated-DNA-[protein]-cysteine methyltransferase
MLVKIPVVSPRRVVYIDRMTTNADATNPATKRELPSNDVMYRALVERDSRFVGVFVVAVKTTGVFCRPTCHARKPRPENVEFFATPAEALRYGYRPCKLCNPLGVPGDEPAWLRPLLDEIAERPEERITDRLLAERGLSPHRVRRWFQRHHGMTFHSYQRLHRLSGAFGRIRNGDDVAAAAFGSGYASLSGFAASFRRATGLPPNGSRETGLVTVTRMSTPLGPMLAGATQEGVCLLEFVDRRMLETQLARLRALLGAEILPGRSPHFAGLRQQLSEYFAGERARFDLPLVVPGTPFQRRVWDGLLQIPYGETRSYQEQAEAIGHASAVRAVARANGDNRIAIVIPCHRVIGKNGRLTGYGGGLWRKQRLLDLERGGARNRGRTGRV